MTTSLMAETFCAPGVDGEPSVVLITTGLGKQDLLRQNGIDAMLAYQHEILAIMAMVSISNEIAIWLKLRHLRRPK
jgi:hypothetical protein